jgi:hypothetical protein
LQIGIFFMTIATDQVITHISDDMYDVGLSKDRVYDIIKRISAFYAFMNYVFIEHGIGRPTRHDKSNSNMVTESFSSIIFNILGSILRLRTSTNFVIKFHSSLLDSDNKILLKNTVSFRLLHVLFLAKK